MTPTQRDSRPVAPRGQSLVEYAIIVPVFLLMLLGMLEMGLAFSHHLTMEYASREGARTGAALGSGTLQFACDEVDPQIIAAVQRVLTGSGAQTGKNLNRINEIRIYRANAQTGVDTGVGETWTPGNGPTIDGVALRFQNSSGNWNACLSNRNNLVGSADSVGVSIDYDYHYVTPLGSLMGATGNPTIHMSDRTVMAVNPGNDQ